MQMCKEAKRINIPFWEIGDNLRACLSGEKSPGEVKISEITALKKGGTVGSSVFMPQMNYRGKNYVGAAKG